MDTKLETFNLKTKIFFEMVTPKNLEDDEFIRIVSIGKDRKINTYFIKTFVELEEIIKIQKCHKNLFISLATSKKDAKGLIDGKKAHLYRRKVIVIDYDIKDNPTLNNFKDFIALIKTKIPSLYYHCVVDTGHGYHFYFVVEETVDVEGLTQINKALAEIVGSDIKACSPTQIMRIPGTLNLKQDARPVSIIHNSFGSDNFKAYSLHKLKYLLRLNETPILQEPSKKVISGGHYFYCIEKMLCEGVAIGERNFALGRIVKYLQDIKGFTKSKALETVLNWNKFCHPPKDEKAVKADFNSYWVGDYKLLGCKVKDSGDQKIIDYYCDKYLCKSIISGEICLEEDDVKLSQEYWSVKNMRKLSGYHYLILCVLSKHEHGLTTSELIKYTSSQKLNKESKPALSYPTLLKILGELKRGGLIQCIKNKAVNKPSFFKLTAIFENNNKGFVRITYTSSIFLINGTISKTEYLVFLYLVRCLYIGNSMTYEDMERDLIIDKTNLSKYVLRLEAVGIIKIEKVYNGKGVLCNRYTILI